MCMRSGRQPTSPPKSDSKKQYSEKELEQEVEARLARILGAQDKGKKHDKKRKKSTDLPGYLGSQSTFDKAKKHKKHAKVPSSSSSSSDSSSDSSEEERKGKKRSKKQRHGKGKKKTRKSKSCRVDDNSTEDTSTDSSDSEDGHFYANRKNFYKANQYDFLEDKSKKVREFKEGVIEGDYNVFKRGIDEQAAESLGKPEKEKQGSTSKKKRGSQGNFKPVFDLSLADQKNVQKETHTRSKPGLGSEPLPPALSKLNKKLDQGARVQNDNGRSERQGPSSYRKKQPDANLQGTANRENNAGKDDWTELLASPNVELGTSPGLASSVGSSDSGHTGYSKRPPLRFTPNSAKGGRQQQRDDNMLGNFSRGSDVSLKISPSASSSNIRIVDSQNALWPGRFEDETFKRRLENDLAGLVGRETVANSSQASTSKVAEMNGDVSNTARGLLDSENFFNATERADEVLRDNQQKAQQQQLDRLNVLRPSSPASKLDHSYEDKCNNYERITQVTSKNPIIDVEGVLGLENKNHPTQNDFVENDQSVVSDIPLALDSRELGTEHEDGVSKELSEPRSLPASLEAEEDSYESSSMTSDDSGGRTESEEDEEIERQKSAHKKRIARRKELTAARAAEAQAAIRERKLVVDKLEQEVTSLQHVLAEREEQQGREAAELRTSIAEVMQALEAEKKLHSSTRMKALSVESQLENENADLAKSLGALQWELEEEMSQVMKARRMIEAKEGMKADLERRLAKVQGDTHSSPGEVRFLGKAKSEDQSFEEEQTDLWKKIQQFQIQAKDLEVKICDLKDTRHVPTETEKELESRLRHLTDHLIQKQAQVEALSSEKATLLIRLETLTQTLEEEKALVSSQAFRNKHGRRNLNWESNYYDMEYGLGRSYDLKVKRFVYGNGETSATATSMNSIPLSPILRQLNGFISAGIFYVRKHRWAQAFTVLYIIVLHLWVWFVVFMNSKPAQTLALQELSLPKNASELKNGSNIINLL
ncbi:hypothetical protein L7F22_001935 [Adiantum nelumboides]|nr:hypothetical protein [Adiantum nelumboides]